MTGAGLLTVVAAGVVGLNGVLLAVAAGKAKVDVAEGVTLVVAEAEDAPNVNGLVVAADEFVPTAPKLKEGTLDAVFLSAAAAAAGAPNEKGILKAGAGGIALLLLGLSVSWPFPLASASSSSHVL